MKLLFDENLSRQLVRKLEDLFPRSAHISQVRLLQANDLQIWRFAQENNFTIVTADGDFYELAMTFGPPPKVIWLRSCDYPTAVAERLLRHAAIRIAEFESDLEQATLILPPT